MKTQTLARIKKAMGFPLVLVALLVGIEAAASIGLLGHPIHWANIPRTWDGMPGILLSHLRHDGWGHLFANVFPLLALSTVAGMLLPRHTKLAWWIIPPVAGLLLWLFGRGVGHVGASGLVYAWFFFLISMMFFHRSWMAVLGAIVALFFFGGLIWVFDGGTNVSWEGHAAGAVAGAFAAWIMRRREATANPGLGI